MTRGEDSEEKRLSYLSDLLGSFYGRGLGGLREGSAMLPFAYSNRLMEMG